MSRGVGAALLAAAVVLSGCGAVEENVTTTSPSPEAPVNPWDLPLEDRPALFDPCAEIPVEAVEEAVGGPFRTDDGMHNHRPNELHTCAWRDDEIMYVVTATWRSRQGFLTDSGFGPFDTQSVASDRPSFQARDRGANAESTCYQIFFTSRGAAVVNVNLMKSMGQYRGETFVDACEVLETSIDPIVQHLPAGDF